MKVQFSQVSKATINIYYNTTLLASSAGFTLYQISLVHTHAVSSFFWRQESCLLLTLAAKETDLSLRSPMVSVISSYTQLCTRKECKVVPNIVWITTRKKKTNTTG